MTPSPGFTTTEFYLTLITQAVAVITILHPGFKAPPGLAEALATLAAGIGTVAYSLSRGYVKASIPIIPAPPAPPPVPVPGVPAPVPGLTVDQAAAAQLRQLASKLDPTQ